MTVRTSLERKPRRGRAKAAAEIKGTRLPLRKLISKHRWKIWGVGLLLLLPAAGVVAGEFYRERITVKAGPAVSRLLDPDLNILGRAYGGLLLIVAAEMAALIWWVRSKSPADFGGRFGVWPWGSAACFLFSICVATDAHRVFAETVIHFRLVNFPTVSPHNTEILCWLVPCLVFGGGIVRALHLDMWNCKSSLFLMWLAVLSWLASAGLQLETKWTVDVPFRSLAVIAAVLLGHVTLLVSMLLHARFVLFESSAPPRSESAGGFRIPLLGSLFRRKGPDAGKTTGNKDESASKNGGGARKSSKSRRTVKKPAGRTARPAGSTDDDQDDTDDDSAVPAPSRPAIGSEMKPRASLAGAVPSKPNGGSTSGAPSGADHNRNANARHEPPRPTNARPSTPVPPRDDADDEDDEQDDDSSGGGIDRNALKGLSKRERRRLQKQWRDQQRAA